MKLTLIIVGTMLAVPMLNFGLRWVIWWFFGVHEIIELLKEIRDEVEN